MELSLIIINKDYHIKSKAWGGSQYTFDLKKRMHAQLHCFQRRLSRQKGSSAPHLLQEEYFIWFCLLLNWAIAILLIWTYNYKPVISLYKRLFFIHSFLFQLYSPPPSFSINFILFQAAFLVTLIIFSFLRTHLPFWEVPASYFACWKAFRPKCSFDLL